MWVRFSSTYLGFTLSTLLLTTGCEPPPDSFVLVPVERARALASRVDLTLIDVQQRGEQPNDRLPGAVAWALEEGNATHSLPSEVPAGGVLVIASGSSVAYRSAAALSRSGRHPIYVCIPENAEQRSSLYAVAQKAEENVPDEDS